MPTWEEDIAELEELWERVRENKVAFDDLSARLSADYKRATFLTRRLAQATQGPLGPRFPEEEEGSQGKTRRERVLKALHAFEAPVRIPALVASLPQDSYPGVANILNNLRQASDPLVQRDGKLWSLTAAGVEWVILNAHGPGALSQEPPRFTPKAASGVKLASDSTEGRYR
jgi:hypothetical protein